MKDLQVRFEKAQQDANALPERPDNQTMLKLYALYKQATLGDVSGERPGGFDFWMMTAASPSFAPAHRELGLALGVQNRLPEAATELAEAVRLDPNDATTHLNLAVVYAQAGRFADARAQAEQALTIRPNYPQAQQLLAAALY